MVTWQASYARVSSSRLTSTFVPFSTFNLQPNTRVSSSDLGPLTAHIPSNVMAECARLPIATNGTLKTELGQILLSSFDLALNTQILQQPTFLANILCSADVAQTCYGICPNADLAGVGVRCAFWLSSILEAILVFKSPEESSQGAWTATILTASITIPAFIQKRQRQLSVYHATLVLNFATFSSIVSLAVAPMCSVWRESPGVNCDTLLSNAVPVAGYEEGEDTENGEPDSLSNLPKYKVHRQRLILSLALLSQIALQWTWVVMLFTDPEFAQKACNPSTIVILFGKPFTTGAINHTSYMVWPSWLLFNLSITLLWGILLVANSAPSVHPVLSRRQSILDNVSIGSNGDRARWTRYLTMDKGRILVLAGNALAFFLSLLFLVSSEVQVGRNTSCLLGGENTDWSFGQVAALLVSLTPSWSICVAFAKKRRAEFIRISVDDLEASNCSTPSIQSQSALRNTVSDTPVPISHNDTPPEETQPVLTFIVPSPALRRRQGQVHGC